MPPFYTLGKLALMLGVQDHKLDRLCLQGRIPFSRAGRLRLFAESDVPAIRAALVEAGYLGLAREEGEVLSVAG